MDVTHLIFFVVYLAMGLGHIPGFKVDRTGAALIGGIAMIVAGKLTPQSAWNAIDYRTIGMLFGLMVVSAAFVVSGFYAWTAAARRHARRFAAGLACHSGRRRRLSLLASHQ